MADATRHQQVSEIIDKYTNIREEVVPELREELAKKFLARGKVLYKSAEIEIRMLPADIGLVYQILGPLGAQMEFDVIQDGDLALIRPGRISDGLWMKPIILERGEWFEFVRLEQISGQTVIFNLTINGQKIAATCQL